MTKYALTLFIYEKTAGDLPALDCALQPLGLSREGSPVLEVQQTTPTLQSPSVLHTVLAPTRPASLAELRGTLTQLSRTTHPYLDFVLQDLETARQPKRLWAFDMDSTLIRAEVIDEYGRELGLYDQISAITASAMRGEIDFNESFRQRLALLKNLTESQAHSIWDRIEMTAGADELFTDLKAHGVKTALLSGGFTHIAEKVQARLGLDSVVCNQMSFRAGLCTGKVEGPIINAEAKQKALESLIFSHGLTRAEVAAVGDGANDIPMLLHAGLGIPVHAKPKVIDAVGVSLRSPSLAPLKHLRHFPL